MSTIKIIVALTLLLFITIILFGKTNIDHHIQNIFYSYTTSQWILLKETEPYHFIFYTVMRKIPLLILITILIALLGFKKHSIIQKYKKGLIIVFLSIVLVPSITVGIKKSSNMPCPKQEIHYGGIYPKTAVWEQYEAPYKAYKDTYCWPAGHASAGFALMSLIFLFVRKRNQIAIFFFTFIIAWSMGLYKMAIGDHYFSHTLITMLLAWILILIIVQIVDYLFKKLKTNYLNS